VIAHNCCAVNSSFKTNYIYIQDIKKVKIITLGDAAVAELAAFFGRPTGFFATSFT